MDKLGILTFLGYILFVSVLNNLNLPKIQHLNLGTDDICHVLYVIGIISFIITYFVSLLSNQRTSK